MLRFETTRDLTSSLDNANRINERNDSFVSILIHLKFNTGIVIMSYLGLPTQPCNIAFDIQKPSKTIENTCLP